MIEKNQLKNLYTQQTFNIFHIKCKTALFPASLHLSLINFLLCQESTLNALGQKVEEVYRNCIGDSEGNLITLQMLTAIERRLGDLLECIELIPADRLAMAERAKEKERRIRSD